MTDAEIDKVEKIDWEIYRSDRRFYTHTQPLEYEDSDFDNDDCNPLYSFFSKELSADVEPDYSNPYWWILLSLPKRNLPVSKRYLLRNQ